MNFLRNLFGPDPGEIIANLSAGYCPNCWGEQEYDDLIREKYRDAQVDVNNRKASYDFVKKFVVTHLDGIRLKNATGGVSCPKCKKTLPED